MALMRMYPARCAAEEPQILTLAAGPLTPVLAAATAAADVEDDDGQRGWCS